MEQHRSGKDAGAWGAEGGDAGETTPAEATPAEVCLFVQNPDEPGGVAAADDFFEMASALCLDTTQYELTEGGDPDETEGEPAVEVIVAATVGEISRLLDVFAVGEPAAEGRDAYFVGIYFDPTPDDGLPGLFDGNERFSHDNEAVHAISAKHGAEEAGGVLDEVGPSLEMLDIAEFLD